MVHKDICIRFSDGMNWFEAVGFLGKREKRVSGYEAIRRCDNGRIVNIRTNKDIWKYFPEELKPYYVVAPSLKFFMADWFMFGWGMWLEGQDRKCEDMDRRFLILRRVDDP